VQTVPIITNVLSSNTVHGEVYWIQHYVINDITEILLKVELNTININLKHRYFDSFILKFYNLNLFNEIHK